MSNSQARAARHSFDMDELLVEISTRFINLPADDVDGCIEAAQGDVCHATGLERSTLWQKLEEPGSLILTHFYQPPGMPVPPRGADAGELFPWLKQQVEAGRATPIARLDAMPPEAAIDRATFEKFRTKSTLIVPLTVAGRVTGCLSFATVTKAVDWTPNTIRRMQLLAQTFANALSRAHSERALRASETRLGQAVDEWSATFDAIVDCVFLLDSQQRIRRANAGAVQTLGLPMHQIGGRNCFDLLSGSKRPESQTLAACAHTQHSAEIVNHRTGRCFSCSVYPLPVGAGGALSAICIAKDITPRKQLEDQLRSALDDATRLRDQLHQQNVHLQQEVKSLTRHARLVGDSASLRHALTQVEQVAPTSANVLLLGETGTGKELVASEIHDLSPRRDRMMVRVNCSAIPATLIESELFGREKGAYTGALSRQVGRFEMASGSTLFLDEIGELPLDIQVKLLRVLQERKIERLGSPRPIPVDVRIVAATNRDLEKLVREGRFREDLFYRLNVFPIRIPPLRERREDIPALVSALVSEFGAAFGKNIESIAKESMEALIRYSWPGNVRELRNVIERAMIINKGPRLRVEPPRAHDEPPAVDLSARAVERDHIVRVLESTGGRIRGRLGAAEILKLKPTTLESRMAKLGIPTRRKALTTK